MIRYMGTKRYLASPVADKVRSMPGSGRVVDLFCGTGAVTSELAGVSSVVMNDANAFLGPMLRSQFAVAERTAPYRVVDCLRSEFVRRRQQLEESYNDRLNAEATAMRSGREALHDWMEHIKHVGSSSEIAAEADRASRRTGPGRYCLATLYFSGGYFSTKQAIGIDALRCAIDRSSSMAESEQDQALAALTLTLDRVLNSPGHSAQFLRPNSESAYRRIIRVWSRDVWNVFVDCLSELKPVGGKDWRRRNTFRQSDALDLVADRSIRRLRAVYADPPYTKDQYSRYYHVHETLFLYDFPGSTGRGRYRSDRFASSFSSVVRVEEAFRSLFESVSSRGIPLILSYPTDGLLFRRGIDTVVLASEYFRSVSTSSFAATHSTMGASTGLSSNQKVENIHVCRP